MALNAWLAGARRRARQQLWEKAVSAAAESVPPASEPTRDQLYERAKELGIRGRSHMNKEQLQRAIHQRLHEPALVSS
jgi:hypothetical protein